MSAFDRVQAAAPLIVGLGASAPRTSGGDFRVMNCNPHAPVTDTQEGAVEVFLEEGPGVMVALLAERAAITKALNAAGLSDGDGLAEGVGALADECNIYESNANAFAADLHAAHAALDAAGAEPGGKVADRIAARFGAYTERSGTEALALYKAIEAIASDLRDVDNEHYSEETAERLQHAIDKQVDVDSRRIADELDQLRATVRQLRAQVAALTPKPPHLDASGNPYLPWDQAGGPNECVHGYAKGIPCVRCDVALFEGEDDGALDVVGETGGVS